MENKKWTEDLTITDWQNELEAVDIAIGHLRLNKRANLFAAGCFAATSVISFANSDVLCFGVTFLTTGIMVAEAIAFHYEIEQQDIARDYIEEIIRLKQNQPEKNNQVKEHNKIEEMILGDDGEYYLPNQLPEWVMPLNFNHTFVKK